MPAFDISAFDVAKYDEVLSRGLSYGIGNRDGQMCIEAAICTALGLPHGDDPQCVAASVRIFKITLNDSNWSSQKARAAGLHDLGLAQLGSLGVVDDVKFTSMLAERTTRKLIPTLFREVFPNNQKCLEAAHRCESEGTDAAAVAAAYATAASTSAAYAARAASYAAVAAYTRASTSAAYATAAAYAATSADEYLSMAANLALEVLRELNSPGIALLTT